MHDLPGTVSTRIETRARARAKSRARLTIWAPLTPTAGSISYRVMTGPGRPQDLTWTPKSANLRSIRRDEFQGFCAYRLGGLRCRVQEVEGGKRPR